MNVYGKITIISKIRVKNKVFCKCECGTEKWINIFNLKKGDIKSCGCFKKEKMKKEAYERFSGQVPKNFTDYSGRRIGCITVLKRIRNRKKETWYLLKCECGEEFETRISTLRRSKFIKCICGFENHSLKKTLQKMIHRCENKKDTAYKWYGAKNISIFEEWRKFPIKFIKWSLKNGWEKGLTIDRIDSYKNYCPENCQWITRSENSKKAAILRWAQKHTE